MRYWAFTLTGLAMAGAAVVAADWGLYHLVRTGTCASGGPYVSARPCPPGTASYILALMGGVFGGLIGIGVYAARGPGGRSSRIGLGLIMWSLLFLTISGSVALAAFGPAAKGGSGAHALAIVLGAVFVPMGLAPLLIGLGRTRSDTPGPSDGITFGPTPAYTPPPAVLGTPSPAADQGDALEKIARLGELRDRGLVTPEEFEEQKRRLLREV